MIASAVGQALPLGIPRATPGVFACLAAVLLLVDLSRRARIQALLLVTLGLAGLGWGAVSDVAPDWGRLISGNSGLIALLSAVTFLRLMAPAHQSGEVVPTGRRALWSAFTSVQLLGAIINLSALFIMGDRMANGGRPERRQVIVLSRGFAGAALWSPFFAAMAASLTFAPGARIGDLVIAGLAVAAIGLLLTVREISANEPRPFVGYPMRVSALRIPAGLAIAVLALHYSAPDISVVVWVTLLAPATGIAVTLARGNGWSAIRQHVVAGLPKGASELILFLSAGVLAGGLASVVASLGGWMPFDSFGAVQAALTFASLLGLSLIGVHPIIGIAAFGTVLAALKPDPTLLAMTFLCAWSLAALVNPLSGVTLAIQARYAVDGMTQLRWHIGYVLKLAVVSLLVLLLYAAL